ncbi:unnamed protein product [Rodentolepis nana]|uniref:Cytochrome c oxidase polypeptide VIIc n=1 Tax=Rodentolepis nana TaxID=102285 RepID=A0A0R3T960_RODNA|nr:unnamed protein product [Rodentolepis nana]
MSALFARTTFLLARNGAPKLCSPKVMMVPARGFTKPAFLQNFYDKLEKLEHEIDEEGKVGANLPFSIENRRALAIKFILFIGIAFNIPFVFTYYQMKNAKSS